MFGEHLVYFPLLEICYLSQTFVFYWVFLYFHYGFDRPVGVPQSFNISDSSTEVSPSVGVQVLACLLVYILTTEDKIYYVVFR